MQAVQSHAGSGQQGSQEPIRRRISNFLSRSISRFRVALLVIFIAGVAALIGYFVYGEISRKLAADSTLMAEKLQDQYDSWKQESDTAKKAAMEKDLFSGLGTLIARYPHQYGGQRGLFIRAQANHDKKAWDAASADYDALAAQFPRSYLAPLSLFDAAVCREETGDTDGALKRYVQASADYKDSSVAPRAAFDVGRLYEAKNDWANAQKTYQSMNDAWPQSLWNRLAKNRLIELKVLGKIK